MKKSQRYQDLLNINDTKKKRLKTFQKLGKLSKKHFLIILIRISNIKPHLSRIK